MECIKQVGMSQSAAPATPNDMTTCLETSKKEKFCSSRHRHGEATGKPETRDEARGSTIVRDFGQFSQFETYQKDRFCSFPHRHGEATGKPETRDEARGSTIVRDFGQFFRVGNIPKGQVL